MGRPLRALVSLEPFSKRFFLHIPKAKSSLSTGFDEVRVNLWWFHIPEKLYLNEGSLLFRRHLHNKLKLKII